MKSNMYSNKIKATKQEIDNHMDSAAAWPLQQHGWHDQLTFPCHGKRNLQSWMQPLSR